MTSRERVQLSLNHKEPDRVPIDFGGSLATSIHVFAYNKLTQHLGIEGQNGKICDLMQHIVEPEEEIRKIIGSDVIMLTRDAVRFGISTQNWKRWTLADGSLCWVPKDYNPRKDAAGNLFIEEGGVTTAQMSSEGLYFDLIYNPLAHAEEAEDVKHIQYPLISVGELNYLESKAKGLYENTEYAILGTFGGSLVEFGLRTFGYEKFLMDLLINQDMLHTWFEILTDSYIHNLERYLNAVGRHIQIIQFSDDLGTQNSLFFSPDIYRQMIKPYHTRMYQYVHRHFPDIKIYLHSCGAIFDVIPDLIEAGVDIINPVQFSAAGMDPVRLKTEFGADLCFWGGGINMQETVINGTLDDIRAEVRKMTELLKPGGGFVFGTVHNIQADVSPEKVLAIFETARKYGDY